MPFSAIVSAGPPAPSQSIKSLVGTVALGASAITQSWYTVPAGKTLYITDIAIYSTGAAIESVQIQAGGSPIFRGQVRDLAPIQMPGIETQPQAAAGQAITLNLPIDAGAPTVTFAIFGIEQ